MASADDFLHCCIESRGCRFSRDCGACIMCDYGIGVNLNPDELKELWKEIFHHMQVSDTSSGRFVWKPI